MVRNLPQVPLEFWLTAARLLYTAMQPLFSIRCSLFSQEITPLEVQTWVKITF